MFTLRRLGIPLQQKVFTYFLKPVLSSSLPAYNNRQNRTLYTEYTLGLEGFLKQGIEFRNEIKSYKESFIEKMQKLENNSNTTQLIFTEDLRKLVALCAEEKEYLDLLINLIKKYYKQTEGISINQYRFGPPVMRLLHIHKLPDQVIEILCDEELKEYFIENSAYQVAMDLLFEMGYYKDILKLMKALKTLPKSCVTLATGANYKISTEESLEHSLNLNKKVYEDGQRPTVRMITFTAALALNQGKPEIALEVCSHSTFLKHYLITNLRVLAKAHLGELDDVMQILESSTMVDMPKLSRYPGRQSYAFDVIEEVEKIINDKLQLELISKFAHLKETLEHMQLISSQNLESALCSTIRGDSPNLSEKSRRWGSRPQSSKPSKTPTQRAYEEEDYNEERN